MHALMRSLSRTGYRLVYWSNLWHLRHGYWPEGWKIPDNRYDRPLD
jgi:hypothetical protein